MKNLDVLVATLLVVGGLNWGLVGFASFDLVASIFGDGAGISRVVYALVGLSALYQALHRMEREGWIESEWGLSEKGKRAKFYRLTRQGERQLAAETSHWREYVEAVARILAPTSETEVAAGRS